MSHASSSRSGMLTRKLGEVFSLVCTLDNSNIAITIRYCNFESALMLRQSVSAHVSLPRPSQVDRQEDMVISAGTCTSEEMLKTLFNIVEAPLKKFFDFDVCVV